MPTLDIAINTYKAREGANVFNNSVKEIEASAKRLGYSLRPVDIEFTNLQKRCRELGYELEGSGLRFRSLTDHVNLLIRRFIGLYGVYRLYNFAKEATIDYANFETGISKLSVQLDKQTLKYLPAYKDAITAVSIRFRISAGEITSALTDILNGGIEASKAIDILNIATKAAKAGFTDVSTVVNILVSILNAYGYSADKAEEITDKLFAATVAGRISFSDLTSSLGNIVSIAASVGLSLDQLIAAMVTMSRAGVDSGKAIFSLRSILDAFLTPSEEAKKVAREFNLELKVSTLASEGLTGVLNKLKNASIEQTSAIFGSMRGLTGLTALLQQTSKLTEDLNAVTNSAGASQEAFGKVVDTTTNKLGYLREEWNALKRDTGGGIIGIIYDVAKGESLSKFLINLRTELVEIELAAAKANLALYPPEEAKQHIAEHETQLRILRKSIGDVLDTQEIFDEKINISGTDMLNYGKDLLYGVDSTKQFKQSIQETNKELEKQGPSLKLTHGLEQIEKQVNLVNEAIKDLGRAEWLKDIDKLKELGKGLSTEELDQFYEALNKLKDTYVLLNKEKIKIDEGKKIAQDSEALREKQKIAQESAEQLFEEIQFEKQILGKTDDERERAIKLAQLEKETKILGVDASKRLVEKYKKELDELRRMKELKELVNVTVSGIEDMVNIPLKMVLGEVDNFGEAIKLSLKNIAASILTTMYEQMITKPIATMASNILMGAMGGLFGVGAEQGAIFEKGRLKKFAYGDIINKPTLFPMANGFGLMGESGPEAVVPLARDKSGRLGIKNEGQSGSSIKIINVLDKSSFEDYLSSSSGERVVVNIMKRNSNVVRDLS